MSADSIAGGARRSVPRAERVRTAEQRLGVGGGDRQQHAEDCQHQSGCACHGHRMARVVQPAELVDEQSHRDLPQHRHEHGLQTAEPGQQQDVLFMRLQVV